MGLFDDPTTATIVGVLILVMGVVTFLELRYFRKKAKTRQLRTSSRKADQLPDEAHNALITTRAILTTMERTGMRSPEVVSIMDEAQTAYERHNYRVTIELTAKAKARLLALKAAQSTGGDLAKLPPISSMAAAKEEPTTKERLQKEFPPGLAQARFAMGLAESSVSGAKAGGREVVQAEELLVQAKDLFDAQDYEGALKSARLAQKSAAGAKVEVIAPAPRLSATVAVPTAGPTCASCGAPLKSDDAFCRKCGAKVEAHACSACGAELAPDDAFCRKCGTPIGA
jgi:ribosomal protein L40E